MTIPIRPPKIALIAIAAMVALHVALPLATIFRPPFSYAGAICVVTGAAMIIWARRAFQATGTPIKPFTESTLLPNINIAIARYREFLDIHQQAATLQDALEARKLIERAKGVLMEKQGLSEQEAYRRIQQQSMNLRRTMREIAEAILIAEEV